MAVLWVIQINFLQWMLVFGATLTTGAVLIIILSPALQNSSKSIFLISGILIAHLLLATSFLLYFFHMPEVHPIAVAAVAPAAPAAPAAHVAAAVAATPHAA